MKKELLAELVKQTDLEKQYDVLHERGYNAKDAAIHLARFAEARMYGAAERHIAELKERLAAMEKIFLP